MIDSQHINLFSLSLSFIFLKKGLVCGVAKSFEKEICICQYRADKKTKFVKSNKWTRGPIPLTSVIAMQMSWYTTRLWRKRILKKKWRSSQIITNSFTYSRWTHADSSKCIIRLELVSTEIAAVSHWVKQKRGDQSFIHRETTSALWFIFLSNFFFRFWNTFFGLPRCALDERCSVSKATERESMIIEYKLLHTHTHRGHKVISV